MFNFITIASLALSVVSAVSGAAIPRADAPSTYRTDILEPYTDYNTRYMALDCEDKHNTQFFDDCCHPMKAGETLANNRQPYCNPANASASASASAASATPSDDGDDDCDDGDDESSSAAPAPTPAPAPAPPKAPEPSPSPAPVPVNAAPEPPKAPAPPPSSAPAPVKTSEPAPAPSKAPAPAPPKPAPAPPKPAPAPPANNGGQTFSGDATWFYQYDTAGACGKVNPDDAHIVALDSAMYGNTGEVSQYCGKTLTITNKSNGKSAQATVADACPTCNSAGSLDMSRGLFQTLAGDLGIGLFKIDWHFN